MRRAFISRSDPMFSNSEAPHVWADGLDFAGAPSNATLAVLRRNQQSNVGIHVPRSNRFGDRQLGVGFRRVRAHRIAERCRFTPLARPMAAAVSGASRPLSAASATSFRTALSRTLTEAGQVM